MADQVRFLTETQRAFYEGAVKYIKGDLGYGGLVYASNWITADDGLLDPMERWSYTAADVIDRHGYFDAKHDGEGSSWSVRDGHTYEDLAPEKVPHRVPVQFRQVSGYPQIMTELDFTHPNRFRGSMTFLTAAYAGLQGADGIYFFALGSNFVRDTSIGKFQVASPAVSATLPATAIMFRRGDVKVGVRVGQSMTLDEVFSLKAPRLEAAAGLEALRRKDAGGKDAGTSPGMLTYFAAPVKRSYGPDADASAMPTLAGLIDDKTVRSVTGELAWDYAAGVITLKAQRACGASGFLKQAGKLDLGTAVIECGNEYAAVVVVSLDDQPLATSKRILVQAMTEEQPYGWKASGGKIQSVGSFPFGVRKIDAKVTFAGREKLSAVALDENGYPLPTPVKTAGSTVTLPDGAIHTIVTSP
jgi:hypothetical protein